MRLCLLKFYTLDSLGPVGQGTAVLAEVDICHCLASQYWFLLPSGTQFHSGDLSYSIVRLDGTLWSRFLPLIKDPERAPEEQTLGIRAQIAIKWLKLNETFEEEPEQVPSFQMHLLPHSR